MKKRIISAILSAAVLCTAAVGLGGCGDGGKVNGTTLTWYTFGDKPADLDKVLAKANEIIEEKIGMKLDMQYIDSASYAEKMKLKMASGEAYDLAFTGYTNDYQNAVNMGGLYDITDLIDEVGLKDIIPEFYFESAEVDGRIYGIPNEQVVSNPVCIYMSKALAEELDIDMPAIQEAAQNAKNFEDIKAYSVLIDDMFAKVHVARPDLYTFSPKYNLMTTPLYEELMGGVGVRRDGSADKLITIGETEEAKLAYEKVNEWFTKGYIRQDVASKGVALTTNEEYRQVAIKTDTWKPGSDALMLEREGEEQVFALLTKPYISRTSALATMNSVGANSKNPKKAVEFLKLINSDKELFNLICWGIEGTNYTLNDEGKVKEIENSGYNGIGKSAWKYGNQFNSLLMEGQEDGIWKETKKMNDEAVESPMLGFVPQTDNIATELSNLTNLGSEYVGRAGYGVEPPSKWLDEYTKKQEQAGSKKVLKELQKQYDEFLKSKK